MTQTEWENEMCIKILDLIENELYIDFRYLDVAISTLIFNSKGISSFYGNRWNLTLFSAGTDFASLSFQSSFPEPSRAPQRFPLYFPASVDSWKP